MYVDPTVAVDPPTSTSSDSSLCSMLDTVMTIQAAHGQLRLDVFNELHACESLFLDNVQAQAEVRTPRPPVVV